MEFKDSTSFFAHFQFQTQEKMWQKEEEKEELLNFPLSSRLHGFIEDIKENILSKHKPINYYVCSPVRERIEWQNKTVKVDETHEKKILRNV